MRTQTELMGSSQKQKRQFLKEAVIKALLQSTPKWNKMSEITAQLNKTMKSSTVLQQKEKRGEPQSVCQV